MPGTPDVSELLAALDGISAQMAKAQTTTVNEPMRQQIAGMAARLRQMQGQLRAEYPAAMAAQQAQLAEINRRAQATLDRVAQLRQQGQADARARATPPSPPPEEPLEEGLGRKLRDELLERFGNLPPGQRETRHTQGERPTFIDLSARNR